MFKNSKNRPVSSSDTKRVLMSFADLRRRKRNDEGDILANSLIGLAIVAGAALVAFVLVPYLTRGKDAVAQALQESVRSDIIGLTSQRLTVGDSPTDASKVVTESLNALNQNPDVTYYPLLNQVADVKGDTDDAVSKSPRDVATSCSDTADKLCIFDITQAEPNEEFWVFVPSDNTYLCKPNSVVGSDTSVPNDNTVLKADGSAGLTLKAVTDANCNAVVKPGRAIFVGGLTDTGSQFCVKYALSNQALESNGFTYWHLNEHPTGEPAGGPAGSNLKEIYAECGMRELMLQYYGKVVLPTGTSTSDNPNLFKQSHAAIASGPGLCGHSTPRASAQPVPSCG